MKDEGAGRAPVFNQQRSRCGKDGCCRCAPTDAVQSIHRLWVGTRWWRGASQAAGIVLLTIACGDGAASRTVSTPAAQATAPATPAVAEATAAGAPTASGIIATPQRPVASQEVNMELIAAARRGDREVVARLLDQGASVHAKDERGVTALIAAVYGNHLPVAELLIKAGAGVNVKDDTQQSAYLIPTADGSVEMLRLMLANGADVGSLDSYNGTGLIRAADRGHVEIIRELLKTNIDINHVNRLGWTALLEAIILGNGGPRHTEVVQLLVDAGANVNLADSNGVTPLAHARQRGYQGIIAILERAGAR